MKRPNGQIKNFLKINLFYSNLETLEKAIVSEIRIAFHKFYKKIFFKFVIKYIKNLKEKILFFLFFQFLIIFLILLIIIVRRKDIQYGIY